MSNDEFNLEFDVMYNNITSNQAPGLNEYEKSVFLTHAQEDIVMSLYGNTATSESFESSEKVRRFLDNLIVTKEYNNTDAVKGVGINSNSKFFQLPDNLAFITLEQIIYSGNTCFKDTNKRASVIPVKQDEYNNIKDNPFRGVTLYKALRLEVAPTKDTSDKEHSTVEIISKYPIEKYIIRYIRKPQPIVLVDLPAGISINGVNVETECELNSLLHKSILERAVLLAKAVWQSTSESRRK